MTWIGRKKIAFIPLSRPNAHPPDQVPADWEAQILRRVLFDPNPTTGADRSLRAYIHAASSGRADLDAVVMPRESVDQQDVPVAFLEGKLGAQLRSQGFNAAAIVMLGGPGAGTAQSGGFWARFVMLEGVGVWAMELMHCLTAFRHAHNMGKFDEMSCACATHPSAYTKAAIGWLGASAIASHSGQSANYSLHTVGLVQPPPSGRVATVRIGRQVPYLMVEARQKVDQFDANIPSEGVIMYRVQTSDPLGAAQNGIAPIELLTTTALKPGQSFTSSSGVTVKVTSAFAGGFTVRITRPADPRCADILRKIADIDDRLDEPGIDPNEKKRLRIAQRSTQDTSQTTRLFLRQQANPRQTCRNREELRQVTLLALMPPERRSVRDTSSWKLSMNGTLSKGKRLLPTRYRTNRCSRRATACGLRTRLSSSVMPRTDVDNSWF
ncbi:MAG TPA: hypothetical protein VN494_00135 [Patescibacteria group bacterium]|nr:hypothetical protein [Patescibacteria group bacterium]